MTALDDLDDQPTTPYGELASVTCILCHRQLDDEDLALAHICIACTVTAEPDSGWGEFSTSVIRGIGDRLLALAKLAWRVVMGRA